ncbi:MAG: endopeptidase La [Planctomycetota bacterium]|nr:MAG: endopeptidase La [Planctomycetota bacterium]
MQGDGGGVLVKPDEHPPGQIVALPIQQRPVFPSMTLPLAVPAGPLADAVRWAIEQHQGWLGFFLTRAAQEPKQPYDIDDIYLVGAVGRVVKHQFTGDGGVQVLCQMQARYRLQEVVSREPSPLVRGNVLRANADPRDPELRPYALAIVTALKDLVPHNPLFADEIRAVLANYNSFDGPGRLADLAASLTTADREDIQDILETVALIPRMEKVLALLSRESEVTQLKGKIRSQIEEKVSEQQRRFFLHEQLKAIKEELGLETDEKSLELERLREAFAKRRAAMSEEVQRTTEEELRKLSLLDPNSPEYGVARNRLEWLTGLPWGQLSEDHLDLDHLRKGLDRDHYGLEEVKDRIIEFCGVRRLKKDHGGGILCLVGPPGTGKTSIGISMARHLGRAFYRLSVGGMRDEAEIKGHRRTYVGALPGKLAQALRRSERMNPLILLDEIDKLSHGLQGDPASALLEVLDPEQNKDFLDHYLDVRLDLSKVLFICTANDISTIPEALRDRMEIIRLSGYIEQEKLHIVRSYLFPKQRKEHGLTTRQVSVHVSAMKQLVRHYAREAGVRRAEQQLAKIMRKVATRFANDAATSKVTITADTIADYLGEPPLSDEELLTKPRPGVITGLAWTALGGATLEVEALAIEVSEASRSGMRVSGQLGDVMQESAQLALSYMRAQAQHYQVDEQWFERHLIHLHVPAGATPKDGPSAGITMCCALYSLARGIAPRSRVGMTGELTLTGRVFPIGGVREKIVAARRAGLRRIILPAGNRGAWQALPDYLRSGLDVHLVEHVSEVLPLIFPR